MEVKTIASSSSGNCYIIVSGESFLLVECGISIKKIKKAVGFSISSAVGCLVSHGHL